MSSTRSVRRQPIDAMEQSQQSVDKREESGPARLRRALAWAGRCGGDVLWLAYIPEGLRPWHRRFADAHDPGLAPGAVFRTVRLFDAPTPREVAFLIAAIRGQQR